MSNEDQQTQERSRSQFVPADDTPAKRLERLAEIQIASMAILKGNPAAYQAFLKRNYAARRTEFVTLDEINACWIGKELDPATGIESLVRVSSAYIRSTRLMLLVTDLGFLDIFDYVPGCPDVSVEELLAASVQHPAGYRFASLKSLRKMKLASGRSKDLLDLEMLPEV